MFTVMVVDDEANVRTPMSRALAQCQGVDCVLEASDGQEAIALLEQRQVHLVITDIRMPAVGGLQLAEYVRRRSPETDVYVLSGHAEFEYATEAMRHQVAEYLLKPISKQKLYELVQKSHEAYRRRIGLQRVSDIRNQALLEKRIHDMLHGVPVPTFDEGLIPEHKRIWLVSFSTKDLQSLGDPSVRYFIRESARESFRTLGTPAVIVEDRLICIVLFAKELADEAWERHIRETSEWMAEKLRIEVKIGRGGCTAEIGDLSVMYMRSMRSLGFTELSKRQVEERLAPIVRQLLAYIRKEYAGSASLTEFARKFQVNANYLSNLFHQETGMTYTNYLVQYRLTEAKRLLRETGLKIYEVSERVGYKEPAYFSRIFKTFEGMSPGDYRSSANNELT